MLFDMDQLAILYERWREAFPSIKPYYAVKCNPDPNIVSTLARLGAGFDCASGKELQDVLGLGVLPINIVYANTCKLPKDLTYAFEKQVLRVAADSVFEIQKIAQNHPSAELILRIKCGDPNAIIPFGDKFGADEFEWQDLLNAAKRWNLPVVGVSFHVGSGCSSPAAYETAIVQASKLVARAQRAGFEPTLLDIGGGFSAPLKKSVVDAIHRTIDACFGSSMTVIAEPGRYFAETVCTHYARIIGKRARGNRREYWINDGIYGSFADVAHDYMTPVPVPVPVRPLPTAKSHHDSIVYGATCDGSDIVCKSAILPDLDIGDWVSFARMGAYTLVLATPFNGMHFQDILRIYA
jgi:ornithine decarboxylase